MDGRLTEGRVVDDVVAVEGRIPDDLAIVDLLQPEKA